MTKSQKNRIVAVARYVILTAWALIVAFPLYWMVSTSFKPSEQWFAWPPVYLPDPLTLDNYLNVWGGLQEYASTVYTASTTCTGQGWCHQIGWLKGLNQAINTPSIAMKDTRRT